VYFVTFCTYGRQALLAREDVRAAFLDGARRACAAGATIGRYVIMPDHVHLFVRVGPEGRLGVTIKQLRERMSRVLRRACPDLKVWQAGFFDHVLRSGESYAEKWEYVRCNPVRAGLVKDAAEWPFQGEVFEIRW